MTLRRRVLNWQDGLVILVGHSYGGSIMAEAGVDPGGGWPRLRRGLRTRGRAIDAGPVRRDPAAAELRP